MILYRRGVCYAGGSGDYHSKPCNGDGGGVRKPRPKPQEKPFIEEGEFMV